MRARSAAASVVRHVGGAAAEATLIAVLVATLALFFSPVYAPAKFLSGTDNAFAAKGGGGHAKPGSGTSSLSLVLLDSTDGSAHYGQQVDFTVSTTATDKPYVRLNCYEGGVWVFTDSNGYYSSFPWPHDFLLRWDAYHTPGASASCTATLYYYGSKSTVNLTSLTFPVYP